MVGGWRCVWSMVSGFAIWTSSSALAVPEHEGSCFLDQIAQGMGDLDLDGKIGGGDLGLLLIQWGTPGTGIEDLDGSGQVDGADLGRLLLKWGPVEHFDSAGFLELSPLLSDDSRIVYVSADGDDVAASNNLHGRGHYRPFDPEIGADPTQPIGSVVAYRTIEGARGALRDASGVSLEGEPEWMLLRRGDVFEIGVSRFIDRRTAGRSPIEPRVYTAYGDPSQPRPIVQGMPPQFIRSWDGGGNLIVSSIEFRISPAASMENGPPSGACELFYGAANIVFEDVRFLQTLSLVVQAVDGRSPQCVELRRCVVEGNWRPGAGLHVQGIFASTTGELRIEECVFDQNGFKEDPFDPSTWTAGLVSTGIEGELAVGTGLQPTRTWYDRNCYLSSYSSLDLLGNVISRGGGGSSIQMRVGGRAERNLLLWNQQAISVGGGASTRAMLQDASIRQNCVLHDDHLLPPGGFGIGLTIGVGNEEVGELVDNVVVHFHRMSNGGGPLMGSGLGAYGVDPAEASMLLRIAENVVVTPRTGSACSIASALAADGVQIAEIGRNDLAVTEAGFLTSAADATRPLALEFGTAVSGGNRYLAIDSVTHLLAGTSCSPSAWRDAGFDPASTWHGSLLELAAASGWRTAEQLADPTDSNGWERDIETYLRSIDPTFVADEEVTVDAGVPADRRRPGAPRVREILADPLRYPSLGGFWSARVLTPEEARIAARRYHAFLTFMERAKANRRGAWDPRYTADAVNNYIREGFGKAPVGQ
jgi:hypothetical protein